MAIPTGKGAREASSPTKTIVGEDQTAGMAPERIFRNTLGESICQGMTFNKTHTLTDEKKNLSKLRDCKLWRRFERNQINLKLKPSRSNQS
jgi:hypothetical protein